LSKTLAVFALVLFAFVVLTPNARAQNIVCDGTCTLSTGASSYAGAATARGKMLNARGSSSPTVAKTKPKLVPKTETGYCPNL
jgi:hypothetical protein